MTLSSRPRLRLAALLAAMSLMVFVTLRVRRSDAQEKLLTEISSAAESQPDKEVKPTTGETPTKSSPSGEVGGVPKTDGASGEAAVDSFSEFSDPKKDVAKGEKKSQTQRKSTIMINGFVVVLPKELIESQDVTVGDEGSPYVAIGRSRKRDVLFGYSRNLNKWVKQPTEIPKTNSVPSLGESVAIVRLDSADKPDKLTYFVFNAVIGRWSSIEVSVDAAAPTIHKNTIVITDGDTTHVFSVLTDEWSSPMAEVADNEPRKPADSGNPLGAQGTGGFGGFFGGGGFGGGLGSGGQAGGGGGAYQSSQSTIVFPNDVVTIPKETVGSGQLTYTGQLAIVPSKDNKALWGYSTLIGKWVRQPVTFEADALVPVVGANVAAVYPSYKTKPDKKTYFAFSSATGRWAAIEVSVDAEPPIVHTNLVTFTDGETMHFFKNDTGKWSTPTAAVADNKPPSATTPKPTKAMQPSAPTAEEPNWNGQRLRYLSYAPDLEVYLVDLDADGMLDVVPIDGTKSSRLGENQSLNGAWGMVRDAARRRREVAEEQAALQESLGPKHPAMVKINERLSDLEAEERDWIARLKAFAPPESFGRVTVIDWQVRLKSEMQQAERDAEQAAREAKSPKNSQDKDQAQARLRESVGKAFASRQKLQQLEAELLRERLRQVDDRLQERGRLRDRIIQRRVEELTNSNLDWGASEPLDLSKADRPQPLAQAPQSPELVPQTDSLLAPETAEKLHGVVYFEAEWCGPCQKLNPILSKLEKEGLVFRRIDADKNPQLVQQFRVTSIPTFIRSFEGREVQRITGLATEDRIREIISASRYRMILTKPVPQPTVPPPQSKSKGNFHLLGDSPMPIAETNEYKPLGPTPIAFPGNPFKELDDRQVVLSLNVYEAKEEAMTQLGLVTVKDGEKSEDALVLDTHIVTDKTRLAKLTDLLKRSDLKVLMEPTITVLNGHTAHFVNGGEFAVPTIVGVGEAQGTATVFRGFGFEFQAQPVVLDNGQIRVSTTITDSKINTDNAAATSGIPSLDSKRLKTELLLTPNEPVLLGPIGVTRENKTRLIVTISAEVVKPHPPAEAVAIVNGEVITYRDLVRWGMSLKELDKAVNVLLLKQAAMKDKLNISSNDIDAEVQQLAEKFELPIDQWYSMLEKERGMEREHYRDFVIWPTLALKRLVGDDTKQQLTFLAGLRAAAKIQLVDPDAKLRPVSTESTEPAIKEAAPSTEPPPVKNESLPECFGRVHRSSLRNS